MRRFIPTKSAVLLASLMLLCTAPMIAEKAVAQWPCNGCLRPMHETNQWFCNNDSNSCPGCYSWLLTNTCDSCITSITISNKGEDTTFFPCCVVLMDPTHETWTVSNDPAPTPHSFTVVADTANGECLAPGKSIQITACGLVEGELIYISWSPADPPCNTAQNEETVVP